ncbi:MAG TPA: hypothetical protein P5232_04385 [Candidatus Moranbacteria bacterium]|nr:hypothetical protein [Candidatus Moranbacteria bacterium]
MKKINKYKELGIDAGKKNVRKIFKKNISNDYPSAFVNIVHDPEIAGTVFTQHMDGDGSKIVQRILHYFETKDPTIFQGAVDDAISMNTGDIAASGFLFGKWVITDVININAKNLPKEIIMKQIALRISDLMGLYKKNGFDMNYFLGGETADLPTQVQSMVFDVSIYARAKETEIISGEVEAGDIIYGFASDGKAKWEKNNNSGIMSNGVTLARIELMSKEYSKKYPFLSNGKSGYRGKFKVNDKPKILEGMTVSEAILSPTRHWAIVIKKIAEKLKEKGIFSMLHGISMNTGGGATKISHVGKGIIYKKKMPMPPSIFQFIQSESGVTWEEMFQDFNCGIGIDIVGENNIKFKKALKEVAKEVHIELFELGICEANKNFENKVILDTPYGIFSRY